MTRVFQRFTKRYANIIGVLLGLAVVSSILLYSGCGMTSSPNIRTNPTPTPDNVRPTSIITFPTAAGIVSTSAAVNITGTASDAGGGTVQSVQVSVDGGVTWNPATGTSAWSFAWSPTLAGHATIKSRALDTSGNQQDPPAEVTVTIQDGTRPTSTITSPTSGAIVITGTAVTITGTGSDTGGGSVQSVEVSVDGGATWNPATGTTAWAYFWSPTTLGPATIKSRALDTWGNQQDPPAEIHVTVDARPTSTITSPIAGTSVLTGTRVSITGTASDAGGGTVARVEVSVDGGATYSAAVGTDAWSFNWTPSAPGQVTIKSRAVDNTGNVQDPPAQIDVTVAPPDTTPPTIISRFPLDGENTVGIFKTVVVDFSEAMDSATVNGSTVELLDPSGDTVPATVSYIADSRRATLDPTGPLSPGTTYMARVKGGDTDPRVKDCCGFFQIRQRLARLRF